MDPFRATFGNFESGGEEPGRKADPVVVDFVWPAVHACGRASRSEDAPRDLSLRRCVVRPEAARPTDAVFAEDVGGRRGELGGPPERRAAIAVLFLRVACCGWGSPALMQRLRRAWNVHFVVLGRISDGWGGRCN